MLFKEKPNSKIWVAQKGLFLPSSSIQELSTKQEESFLKTVESSSPQELGIVNIGLLPTTVQQEFENIILTQEQKELLSIFQEQYRDISRWLVVFAFPNDEVEARLKKGHSNLLKPLADYFWKMLEVFNICLIERQIGKNSTPDFLYLLWFDMIHGQFLESLKNCGFLMPLSNNHPKSKRELMKIWENDVIPRLDATDASVNDYSMFSEIDDNWERFEQRGHRIFFDMCLRWGKENSNFKVINIISDLLKEEKKLIHIVTKTQGSGMYQVLSIHDDGIHVTGRKKVFGFGKPSASKKKKSKSSKKNK